MERLFTFFFFKALFFFFPSLDLVSICGECVYLRRNENYTQVYVEKEAGSCRAPFVSIQVLAQPGQGQPERQGGWQAVLCVLRQSWRPVCDVPRLQAWGCGLPAGCCRAMGQCEHSHLRGCGGSCGAEAWRGRRQGLQLEPHGEAQQEGASPEHQPSGSTSASASVQPGNLDQSSAGR